MMQQPPNRNAADVALTIPRNVVNHILQHAQSAIDEEVCGLIGARHDQTLRCYPVANVAAHPQRRYRMDPRQQIDALRQMREAGETLFAIYHSHPHGPAEPSAIDLDEAAYTDALYIIVSLDIKGVLEMRGFRLANGRAEEVALELGS